TPVPRILRPTRIRARWYLTGSDILRHSHFQTALPKSGDGKAHLFLIGGDSSIPRAGSPLSRFFATGRTGRRCARERRAKSGLIDDLRPDHARAHRGERESQALE